MRKQNLYKRTGITNEARRQKKKDWRSSSQMKSKYGITLNDYKEMLRNQNSICAACLKPVEDKRLCIDHDHRTGKIRGLVHPNCNAALGLLKEDPQSIRNLANYIESKN